MVWGSEWPLESGLSMGKLKSDGKQAQSLSMGPLRSGPKRGNLGHFQDSESLVAREELLGPLIATS